MEIKPKDLQEECQKTIQDKPKNWWFIPQEVSSERTTEEFSWSLKDLQNKLQEKLLQESLKKYLEKKL